MASFPDLDGRSEAPFFLLRILAMPVAAAFIVFNRAIVPMTGFGAAFFLVKSQSNFAVAALSIPASTPAPRLLVYPVARATAPSSTSIILPIMTSDKPAVFSMLPAPCQVSIPPVMLIALGIVKISLRLKNGFLSLSAPSFGKFSGFFGTCSIEKG